MLICCISDTHERHQELEIPPCDLLLHGGDITGMGKPHALIKFNDWCHSLLEKGTVRKIICIAGNHDFLFERNPAEARSLLTAPTYLEDSGYVWEGLSFWGTPWQPWFYDWAFNLRTEEELRQKFQLIPPDTDILLSHGPPKGILDRTVRGDAVGSTALLQRIREIRPKLVVFGHIHEGYGKHEEDGITYLNASTCDVHYRAVNEPLLFKC
ncbi:metallophosphatase domain-containing protein [bacterium]|nr:metallophosphatase domain-containing protein [bacterium]